MDKYNKYIGISFNSLTCLEHVSGDSKPSQVTYLWKCTCGNTRTATYANVQQGHTKYCTPCGSRVSAKNQVLAAQATTRHSESKTPLYRAWTNLRVRCTKHPVYIEKGIKCCAEWDSYEQFKEDMGASYFEHAQLDRIRSNEDYCKSNCQWLSASEHSTKTNKDKRNVANNRNSI